MIIINTLDEIRKDRGYTQEQMASLLKVAVSTYNQYENGARTIPKEIAEKVCSILNINISDIFLPVKFTISKL